MTCAECGAEFEPSKYYPRQKYCSRKCRNRANWRCYYETHKEKRKEYRHRYYEAHKECHKEYRRRYYEAHKEKCDEYRRRYYEEHREEILLKQKRWRWYRD